MNYHEAFNDAFNYATFESIRQLNCCGVTEAIVIAAHRNSKEPIRGIISAAVHYRHAFLVWNITPFLKSNREVEKIVSLLPCTTFVGEQKNQRTGHVIRMYVTDLIKEW